jgi:hypothetical protein
MAIILDYEPLQRRRSKKPPVRSDQQVIGGRTRGHTRHGHPVVELKAVQRPWRRVTAEDMDWLAARRVDMNSIVDAGTLLSGMRDDEAR